MSKLRDASDGQNQKMSCLPDHNWNYYTFIYNIVIINTLDPNITWPCELILVKWIPSIIHRGIFCSPEWKRTSKTHLFLCYSKLMSHRQNWRCTPTPCIYVSDEVSASLRFQVSQSSIMGEIIEQGSIFPLWQQGNSDWWPLLPQLDAVGGVKVLQG